MLQRGAGFLIKIVLANAITPYEYGIITMVAISLPGILQLATNLNFYYLLAHSEEGKNYFGFTILYSLIITILLSILLFLFSNTFFQYLNLPMDNWQLLYAVIIISIFPLSILVDLQGFLAGQKIYSLSGLIMTIPSIFRLLIIVYLVYFDLASLDIIMLVFAISYIIPLFFILFSKHSMGLMHQIKNINIPSKKMFAFAGSLFIVGSFSLIGQYLIKIVVSHELGIIWQGYYDVSLTLSSILVFAQGTMSYISIPEATNSNRNAIYEKGGFGDVTRGLLALMMFLLIILYFYSGFIIDKIFSKDYVAASDYVFILAIGYLFLFVQSFLVNLNLSFAKNAKDYISTTLLALLLLPLFYFMTEFLITLFKANGYGNGFIGAYLSFTLILMLYTILTIYYSKDLSPLGILLQKLDKLIISFMISFIIIYLLNHYFDLPTLIGMVISGIIFCFLIFSTGYLKISLFLEMFRGSKG